MGNFDYGMTLGAIWTGTSAIQQATTDLTTFTMTVKWVEPAAEKMATGYNRGITRMIWGTQLLIMYGGFLYQNMIREELMVNTLANAQDRYNEAVREYGPNSEQAIRAARALENAQTLVARANTMATLMTVSFGFQIVATGVQIVQQLPRLLAWVSAHWALASAQAALEPYKAPLMIGAALAVGAVAGYGVSQLTMNSTYNLNATEGQLSQAQDWEKRETMRRLRAAGA